MAETSGSLYDVRPSPAHGALAEAAQFEDKPRTSRDRSRSPDRRREAAAESAFDRPLRTRAYLTQTARSPTDRDGAVRLAVRRSTASDPC